MKELERNNDREWFAENKSRYERARADFETLIGEIIPGIAEFDSDVGYPEPKKCLFRIYRDTRFSADKRPYKTNFGAIVRPGGRAGNCAGYYLHLEPGCIFLSSGLYMLPPDAIKRVRRFIYEDFDNFRAIVDDEKFKKEFGNLQFDENEMLKRVPAGFDGAHPAAEYMKLKHFYVMKTIDEKQLFDENFAKKAVKTFRNMYPFGKYMNDIMNED